MLRGKKQQIILDRFFFILTVPLCILIKIIINNNEHSPWERIEPFYTKYNGKFISERLQKYASMISNMDMNIGRILKHIDDVGIAENTFIIFTSDNGPENEAGSAGKFKGQKRLLAEGGIRVPAIIQWKGKIAAGTTTDKFALTTDLFPTFLHIARIRMPSQNRIDGVSFLPMILNVGRSQREIVLQGDERVIMWYTHSIGIPKLAAAQSHGFKLMWNDYEGRPSKNLPPPLRLFDMRSDPYENNNLLKLFKEEDICRDAAKWASTPQSWRELETLSRGNLNSKDLVSIHKLFEHLRLKLHFFRFIGERDWAIFHSNKQHETDMTCSIRKSSEFLLSLSSHILSPEFCGESAYAETGPPFCRCSISNCSSFWFSNQVEGWTRGQIPMGLSYFSPVDYSEYSLFSYLQRILEWSRYNPPCKTLSDTSNKRFLDLPLMTPHCLLQSVQKNSSYWAEGEIFGDEWKQHCVQRIHRRRDKSIYLSGHGCGTDAPLVTINHVAMQIPLSICPKSLTKAAKQHIFDDNFMMFVLSDLIYGQSSMATPFDTSISHNHPRKIGIIDVVAATYIANSAATIQSNLVRSPAELSNTLNDIINGPIWGTISFFERRIHSKQLQYLVIPLQFEANDWTITIVNLSKSQRNKHKAIIFGQKSTVEQISIIKSMILAIVSASTKETNHELSLIQKDINEHLPRQWTAVCILYIMNSNQHIFQVLIFFQFFFSYFSKSNN